MPKVDIPPTKKWIDSIETFEQLLHTDLPEPEWLVKNILPKPGLVAITGKPGSYKTWFTQWIIQRLAHEKPMFDRYEEEGCWFKDAPSRRMNVLFIEEEMNRRQIKKRMVETKTFGECYNFYWNVAGGFDLQNPKILQELEGFIKEKQIDLIVFDPFTSCTKMKDENSNGEARIVMDLIRHYLVDSELECTVLFVHHPAKGDESSSNIRGAGDILGKCDMHFVINVEEQHLDYAKIKIECGKSRYEPINSFFAILQRDYQDMYQRFIWTFGGLKVIEDKNEKGEEFLLMKKYLHDHPTADKKEVADIVNLNLKGTKFRRLWDELTR